LKELNIHYEDLVIKYAPEKFIAAVLKQKQDSSSTCLVFESGKIVCVGSKSIEKSREIASFFTRNIYRALTNEEDLSNSSMCNFQVRNIVVAASIGWKLNLIAFEKSSSNNKEVMFVPELFPGLKWRPYSTESITIIVFESGKINITGIRNVEQINSIYEFARRRLLKFRKML
jgi:transcription initiation factor TFIID TATA-box-binding protein